MGFTVCSLGVVVDANRILLIKRTKPPFMGLWGMPAGKVETGEHIEETAVRETKEETDIDADFEDLMGILSEHIHEDGKLWAQFIIMMCKLRPKHTNHRAIEGMEVKWFDLDRMDDVKDQLIPSDYLIIKSLFLDKKGRFFKSIMDKEGNNYTQKEFVTVL
jgi:ADP-ribose pyrophosphatase YjhB (NUDIX family)